LRLPGAVTVPIGLWQDLGGVGRSHGSIREESSRPIADEKQESHGKVRDNASPIGRLEPWQC
jgi:hypothetical protein